MIMGDYIMALAYLYQTNECTHKESQGGQGSPKRKKKKTKMRKGLLNRLKMRMVGALKGEQYR